MGTTTSAFMAIRRDPRLRPIVFKAIQASAKTPETNAIKLWDQAIRLEQLRRNNKDILFEFKFFKAMLYAKSFRFDETLKITESELKNRPKSIRLNALHNFAAISKDKLTR